MSRVEKTLGEEGLAPRPKSAKYGLKEVGWREMRPGVVTPRIDAAYGAERGEKKPETLSSEDIPLDKAMGEATVDGCKLGVWAL